MHVNIPTPQARWSKGRMVTGLLVRGCTGSPRKARPKRLWPCSLEPTGVGPIPLPERQLPGQPAPQRNPDRAHDLLERLTELHMRSREVPRAGRTIHSTH